MRSFLVPILLLGVLVQRPLAAADERVERRLVALGTWLELELGAVDRATALAASGAAVRAIEAVEARLSTWRDDSELARLNRQPVGEPLALSPELSGWLQRARGWCERTGGTFDPSVGALVSLWGLRAGGVAEAPDDAALGEARAGLGRWSTAEGYATRLDARVVFEEGAFGKGAALEAGLEAARAAGAHDARIDLGGQLAFLGRAASVDVAHPDRRDEVVATLRRAGGSFATTGNSERGIVVAGVPLAHVLDPRTGCPAPDWGSLTVWAPRALDADALSTALYVLGPARAVRWADENTDVEVLALERTDDGSLLHHASRAFVRALNPSTPNPPVR
ncbi:MAG: FAD:protein FMN transferase [Planctomycetota bacterium]